MASLIEKLTNAKRVVIKIGSALLVDGDTGELRKRWLVALAEDVAEMRARGQEVLIVSSGSIAMGRTVLGLPAGQLRLEESQAAAATGQVLLAHAYQEILGLVDLKIAQILLTLSDTEERRRYLNARSTLSTLLSLGSIPVINENDTVATSEIRYGDNDRLAARVAQMMGADCLVLLSDVDGLYDKDPTTNADATFLPEIHDLSDEIMAMGGGVQTAYGSGGMITKLKAAQIATQAGCSMIIASGKIRHPLQAIEKGDARFSCFVATDTPRTARKKWIAGSLSSAGTLTLDTGAEKALGNGKSLLPAGVTRIDGDFERGDLVTLISADGKELGRGLSNYSSEDAKLIIGHKSGEIADLLGYSGRDELVHRDEMALN
ncbi:glutamate 5-kinase [Sneathiella sp. P13V-1]|uniref:glutamate 5-kinase n=1 Tax=Sneathiella sp. P13V-1 TaxID=2697366 RepID=UPI00187BB592|nr:glutamate 5-kinase [Sneathiella sp. P13V-1]MBE7636355.1 glutamate 5-kinase [Sneathiella sp. P13V-1]